MNRITFFILLAHIALRTAEATQLGDAAAQLQPGNWTVLNTSGFNADLLLNGRSGTLLSYADSAMWNPIQRRFIFMGAPHCGGVGDCQKFISYDEATNSWTSCVPSQSATCPARLNVHGHSYEHNTMDPTTGDWYRRLYASESVQHFNPSTGTWNSIATMSHGYSQVAGALAYFPELFGSRGGMIFAQEGELHVWEKSTNRWRQTASGLTLGRYHNFAEYNPVHRVVIFGGGNGSSDLYKMTPDENITKMANAPIGLGIHQTVITVDPITGDYLVFGKDGVFYIYDVISDTWRQQGGSTPPPLVPHNNNIITDVIAAPITTHGVVMVVRYDASGSNVYLYKHAPGSPPPPDTTPPSVSLTSPSSGTVIGDVIVAANASDDVGVAGVQFKLDGSNLGLEQFAPPYSSVWNTASAQNGLHELSALARDGAGNQTASAVTLITVNNGADVSSPSTPQNVFAVSPSSGRVDLSWTESSDNTGITGYNIYRCTGSGCSPSSLAITVSSTSYSDTTLSPGTTYGYAIDAVDGAGNVSSRSNTAAVTTQSGSETGGSSNFANRCASSGVIRCIGFDNASDIAGSYGDNSGILPGATTPSLDSSTKASGNNSIRFTIPSNSGSDTSGSYFTNFSDDLATQFGEGQEFYVQWRQRFSPEVLSTIYEGGGGWKQSIIGEGDRPGTLRGSCTQLEIVTVNGGQRGFTHMYHSCGGKDSRYEPLDEPFGASDFKIQNAMPSPFCLYSNARDGNTTGCFTYKANQWMTFQVHVRIGTWYKNDRNYHRDSTIELWIADEGSPSQLAISRNQYDIANNDPAAKYGKIWLLPYHTGKSSSQSHPTGYVWYDELIISRNRIPDPSGGSGTPVDTTPPASPSGLLAN